MKVKIKKFIKYIILSLLIILLLGLVFPTWTKRIDGKGSISELSQIEVNGTKIDLMIRGTDYNNPILLFVHGGPANSEIPYARKYQDLLEQSFIVVNYDQRGSGKSFHLFESYKELSAQEHVEDLSVITDYLTERYQKDKVILIGHSFGTYIATIAASLYPEKYTAYIGIGQVSDTRESELDSLNFCIQQAEKEGNLKDYKYLQSITEDVISQKRIVPRKYVRKYGGAAIKINDGLDLVQGMLFGTEYNLYDAITYGIGALKSQKKLLKEEKENPLPQLVTQLDLPFYFIMGEQDYMTSSSSAKNYFEQITSDYEHIMILYPGCAHFPQFEEKEKFYDWITVKFGEVRID